MLDLFTGEPIKLSDCPVNYRTHGNPDPTLPYPTLPFPTLPYPTLPYPSLLYPTLPLPTLPYPTLPYPTLSYPILPYPTLPYPINSVYRYDNVSDEFKNALLALNKYCNVMF